MIHVLNNIFCIFKKQCVRYLVWDFDGTLYQNHTFAKELKSRYKNFASSHSKYRVTEKQFNRMSQLHGRWSRAASALTGIDEVNIMNSVEQELDSVFLPPNPKLVRSIIDLPYTQYILSNSSRKQVTGGLLQIGFPKRGSKIYPFKKIFTRDDMPHLKPHPSAFRLIYRHTGAYKINHLIIGDSPEEDLIPAQKIGFQGIHIDHITTMFPNFTTGW